MNKHEFLQLNREADAFSQGKVAAAFDMVERIKPFGLTYFLYNRLVDDDKYLAISIQNDWFRQNFGYSHDRQIFDTQMETIRSKEPEDKYALWQFSFSKDPLMEALRLIDINHGITLYRDQGAYKESFHFASTNENHQILNFYLNNLDILDALADDFVDGMGTVLDHQTTARYVHVEKKPFIQHSVNQPCPPNESMRERHLICIKGKEIFLTNRQYDCFQFLKQGYSNKQMAHKLGRSHRTIEGYVGIILEKFKFTSRQDFIDLPVDLLTK